MTIRDATTVLKAEVQADPVGMANLVPNPNGELGAWFWVTPLRFTKVTGEAGPVLRLQNDTGATDVYTQTNPISVLAGEHIAARLDTVAGTAGHNLKMRFRYFNALGELIATSSPTGTLDVTTPATHYLEDTAPAGTTFAKLKVDLFDGSSSPPDIPAYADFTDVMVTTAATTISTPFTYVDPETYTDVLSPTASISITRAALGPGVLGVRIIDTSLDPATTDALRTGQLFRIRALNDDTSQFEDLAGRYIISRAQVTYDLTKPPEKQTAIELTVVDAQQLLSNSIRPNSVAAIDHLPFVVETVGVPFNVNGETGTLIDHPDVTARLDQATALDQVLLTRDTETGYAWVDKQGIFQAWSDRGTDFYGGPVTFDESTYSAIDLAFDTDECVNEVVVVLVWIDPDSDETQETTYGPYRDEAAIAESKVVRRGTFRVTGLDVGDVTAYAAAILDASSQPQRRVNSITVPIREPADITPAKALIDLYATANIINTAKGIDLDQHVTSITHTIQATDDGVRWLMTLGFATLENISNPAPVTGASGNAANGIPGPPGLPGDDAYPKTFNDQTGTSYTLDLDDGDPAVWVRLTNASPITLTIPPNSTTAFPVGTVVNGSQMGAGQVTITPGSGVTLRAAPGAKIAEQYGTFALLKLDTDEWLALGRLAS